MKAKLSCIPTEVPAVVPEAVQEKPVTTSLQQQEEISPQIAEINTTDVKDTIVGTEVKENRTPLLAVTSQEMAEQECEDLRKMVGVLPSSAMLNISILKMSELENPISVNEVNASTTTRAYITTILQEADETAISEEQEKTAQPIEQEADLLPQEKENPLTPCNDAKDETAENTSEKEYEVHTDRVEPRMENSNTDEENIVKPTIWGTESTAENSETEANIERPSTDVLGAESGVEITEEQIIAYLQKQGFEKSMQYMVQAFGTTFVRNPKEQEQPKEQEDIHSAPTAERGTEPIKYVSDTVYICNADRTTYKPAPAGSAFYEANLLLTADEIKMLYLYREIHKAGFSTANLSSIEYPSELEITDALGGYKGYIQFNLRTRIQTLLAFVIQACMYLGVQYEYMDTTGVLEEDKHISLYRHIIEFSDFDMETAYKFYKDFRKKLCDRRDMKDMHELMTNLLQSIITTPSSKALFIGDFTKKLKLLQTKYMSYISNDKKYKPRVSPDIFEQYLGVSEGHFNRPIF